MGLIFVISSFALPMKVPSFVLADKLVHVLEFGLLASLIYFALKKSGVSSHPIFIPFLIAFLYGVSDEIHQYFVLGRDMDLFDAVANAAGSLIFPLGIHAINHGRAARVPKKVR